MDGCLAHGERRQKKSARKQHRREREKHGEDAIQNQVLTRRLQMGVGTGRQDAGRLFVSFGARFISLLS